MSNLIYIKPNEELILEVTSFNYTTGNDKYYPDIQWEMEVNGIAENIGMGKSIRYTVDEQYEGEKVTFRAYLNEKDKNKYPMQSINCIVAGGAPKNLRVRAVEGQESASVGETVEFEVTEFNVEKNPTASQKYSIKWDVKIGNENKKVFVDENGDPYRGDIIEVCVPEEWMGEEVIVMPYLHSSTERIAVRVEVPIVAEIVDVYWKEKESTVKNYYDCPNRSVTLYIEAKNYHSGETVEVAFVNEDGKLFVGGKKELIVSAQVDDKGIAIVENFEIKYER
jgi:hypothetical protein